MLRFGFEKGRHKGGQGFSFSLKPLAFCLFLIFCLVNADTAFAGSASLAWNAPTERVDGTSVTSSDIKGYNLHYGTASGSYTQTQPITGNVTTYTITNLTDGANYYFAVSAIDTADKESGYSTEACKVIGSTSPCATTNNNGGGNTGTYSYSASGSGESISGGGCGFAKDTNGKGQMAKGEGLSLILMLIITLAGISLARKRTRNITATREGVLVMNIRKNSLIKIATISFLLTIFWSASSYAQPNITSFSGTPVDKGTLTITGTGFGTKTPAAPLKWDDFESGTVGNDVGNGWWNQGVGSSGGPNSKYDDQVTRSGSAISVLQDYTYPGAGTTGGGRTYGQKFGLVNLNNTKYFISFWRYMTTTGSPVRNFKPLALRGGPPGAWDSPEARHDIYPINGSGHTYTSDCNGTDKGDNWNNAYNYPLNSWNRVEYYIDHGDVGVANGKFLYYFDGILRTKTENTLFRSSNCTWSNLYLHGYFARESGDNDAAAYIWIDNVYIDTTQARVEISDSPTWNTTTTSHKEIQIPSAWSDTSITITLNQGSFANFNNIYLYVIDGNGNVNTNGLPLCSSCLKPPTWQ